MLLADATAIVKDERFHLQAHDAVADREKLTSLADWCSQFSPLVSVEPPDSLYFDLDGVTHLFGDEPALAAHVSKRFRSKGYQIKLAIADSFSAAWAMAHYSRQPIEIVHSSAEEKLSELPVSALRLTDEARKKLCRLGIHTIKQLAELPRDSLPSRVGSKVLDRLDCLMGAKTETICSQQPRTIFEQEWLLDQATNHWETIEHVVRVLLERLANQLRHHGRGACRFTIRFDCQEDRPVQMEIGLYRPSADANHFNSLAQMHLETARNHKKGAGPFSVGCKKGPVPFFYSSNIAVECVTVVASGIEILEQQQKSLLAENHACSNELADLIERLSGRLGANRVVKAVSVDDWQPEKAFRYESLTEPMQRGKCLPNNRGNGTAPELNLLTPAIRPLRMFFPPEPLDVVAVIPDGPPARFHFCGEQQTLRFWGPERFETAWWRGACIKRDYYGVETKSASRFWLFRRLGDGQWFLHGSFD